MGGNPEGRSTTMLVLTVLVPFGLGYYMSYLLRTVNVVIAPQLARELSLDAADLGLLTSIYFITFAAFQLPLGLLLDRYGPRLVQAMLLLMAALGTWLFSVGDDFLVLAVARGCIGFGVSGCLMAALQANVIWWPSDRLALYNGCVVAFGSFGALSATVPVDMASQLLGWRGVFAVLAGLCLLFAALVYFVVPEKRREKGLSSAAITGLRAQIGDLHWIYGSGFFWRIGLMIAVHNAAFFAYQTLWMGAWLRDVAAMAPPEIAGTLLWFNVGMFAGVLGIGAIADWAQRLGVRPISLVGIGIGLSILVQALFALEVTSLVTLQCGAFGFFGSSAVLVYAVFGQHFPSHIVGRANTAQNLLIFIAAFATQWGIGAIINLWPGTQDGQYEPAAHQAGFLVVIGVQVLALIWFLRLDKAAPPVPDQRHGG